MRDGKLGLQVEGRRVNIGFLTVYDMVRIAYRAKQYQLTDSNFLTTDRWDIQAELPEGASSNDIPEMLQTLLEDRFKLQVHRETKQVNGYALVVAREGAKFKPAEQDQLAPPDPTANRFPPSPGGVALFPTSFGRIRITAPKEEEREGSLDIPRINLSAFADLLSPILDKPVLDMTGLAGAYQISLNVDGEAIAVLMMGMSGIGISQAGIPWDAPDLSAGITRALQKIGMRLEQRKLPVEMIVVDHVEKAPTEN